MNPWLDHPFLRILGQRLAVVALLAGMAVMAFAAALALLGAVVAVPILAAFAGVRQRLQGGPARAERSTQPVAAGR